MLDFSHIINTPGIDIRYFEGDSQGTNLQVWQTWRKSRGTNWIFMLGVGAGGSGGCGYTNIGGADGGGGSGGGSGGQGSLFIPTIFVPDVLYIQCGTGGINVTANAAGVNGSNTYIAIEPYTTANPLTTFLLCPGGTGGGFGVSGGSGQVGGAAGAAPTLGGNVLAGKGFFSAYVGQAGGIGGAAGASPTSNVSFPVTGLMVTGGAGGGSATAAVFSNGASITLATATNGSEFFYTLPGGVAGSGSTPGTAGQTGITLKNFLMNTGGTGGGSSSDTSGSNSGQGGGGAPGCGGGGSGGAKLTGMGTFGGDGGDGFVWIISGE